MFHKYFLFIKRLMFNKNFTSSYPDKTVVGVLYGKCLFINLFYTKFHLILFHCAKKTPDCYILNGCNITNRFICIFEICSGIHMDSISIRP